MYFVDLFCVLSLNESENESKQILAQLIQKTRVIEMNQNPALNYIPLNHFALFSLSELFLHKLCEKKKTYTLYIADKWNCHSLSEPECAVFITCEVTNNQL